MKKKTGSVRLVDAQGKPLAIPQEGTLSLLALGYKGIMAWREVRRIPTGALIKDADEQPNEK